ncbi:MAG TPA: hypothetical protein VHM90_01550 [Phycisphaerae bacterium]|nr:hypothetical protein [Phycisphaerae bacterium]
MPSLIASIVSLLAQLPDPTADPSKKEGEVMKWGAVLTVVIIIGGGVIMMIRRRLRDAASNSAMDTGFSLSDLRAMRDRGEITIQEYEQTRERVIAKVKGKPLPQKGDAPPPAAIDGHEAAASAPPELPLPEPPEETSLGENPPPPPQAPPSPDAPA